MKEKIKKILIIIILVEIALAIPVLIWLKILQHNSDMTNRITTRCMGTGNTDIMIDCVNTFHKYFFPYKKPLDFSDIDLDYERERLEELE